MYNTYVYVCIQRYVIKCKKVLRNEKNKEIKHKEEQQSLSYQWTSVLDKN